MKGFTRIITVSALGAAATLAVGCDTGTFKGEYVRGDYDTRSAMAECKKDAMKQDYPAKCDVSGWNQENKYGEVWLVNTASKRTESGEEIKKIWVLERQ